MSPADDVRARIVAGGFTGPVVVRNWREEGYVITALSPRGMAEWSSVQVSALVNIVAQCFPGAAEISERFDVIRFRWVPPQG